MARKFNTIWPLPVYVATFADGEVVRLSFGSAANKPLDFARGRRMTCHIARKWLAVEYEEHGGRLYPSARSLNASMDRYYSIPPRDDIVAGHVEIEGAVFRDPHFDAPVTPALRVIEGGKARKVAYDRILAALPDLTFAQLEELESVLASVIDEKLAA